MPSYRGISTAAISVLAGWEVWNGSSWVAASNIPGAGDTAYANGFTKRIDQSWAASIRNDTFQGTTASGRFEILSAGITFSGDRHAQSALILYVSYGSGTSTILGTPSQNTATNTEVVGQSGGILNVDNLQLSSGDNRRSMLLSGAGNGFVVNTNTVTGANGVGSAFQYGLSLTGSNYVVNLNGITQAGTASAAQGVFNGGSGNVINNYGTILSSATSSGVHDNVGAVITNYGIISGGTIPALTATNAVATTSGSLTQLGTFVNAGTIIDAVAGNAVRHGNMKISASPADGEWQMRQLDNASRSMYTAGLLTGYPPESKVEDGTVYGPSSEFEGTLVPVVIDTAQLASDLLTEMNTSNLTIAQGLRDGMGASAAAIAAVGSINVIP